jgi:hypothetical protein
MKKKAVIGVLTVICAGVAIWAAIAVLGNKKLSPDFANKSPEQIKEYFQSEEYQKLELDEQIAIKKKVFGEEMVKAKQDFVEQAKVYAKKPENQKQAYLDELIEQYVTRPQQKYEQAEKEKQTQTKYSNEAEKKTEKKFTSENYRGWSEKMQPQQRAYITELKEAMRIRMEERGIEIGK